MSALKYAGDVKAQSGKLLGDFAVIGTDPGGTDALRVTGNAKLTGTLAALNGAFSPTAGAAVIGVSLLNNRATVGDRVAMSVANSQGVIGSFEGFTENAGNNRGSIILRSGNGLGGVQDVLTLDSNKLATFAGVCVVGTDPGGSELLRVGGAGRLGGALTVGGVLLCTLSGQSMGINTTAVSSTFMNVTIDGAGTPKTVILGCDASGAGFVGSLTNNIFSIRANNTAALTIGTAGTLTLPAYGSGGGLMTVGAADSGGVGFKLLRVPN
jgi:hypothetical protein